LGRLLGTLEPLVVWALEPLVNAPLDPPVVGALEPLVVGVLDPTHPKLPMKGTCKKIFEYQSAFHNIV